MLFRYLVLLLIAGSFTTYSNAQFHIGAKAGVNAGKIDGKSFKQEFEYSYLVGGFAEIGLGSRFSINPEVLFSQTTATRDNDPANTLPDFKSDQFKAKLNYLSIPILANVKLAGPLHIEAGPQFGVILNSNDNLFQNGKDAFKRGDFSVVGGAALHFSIIRVSARYVVGLSNLSDLTAQEEWKSQALQFSLGLAF